MVPKGIKASKLFERKSKVKAVEWVAQKHSQGTTYVSVDVSPSKNEQTPQRDTVRMEIDNHVAVSREVDPPSMDVDDAFWIEEPDVPERKRVSSPTCPF